jgi:3-oxoacyl-[acyl-carrier protein] reductase
MKDLQGKVALVTGAGQGIGEAIAMELADCGSSVALVDLNLAGAEHVSRKLARTSGAAFPVKADVSLPEDVESAVEQIITRFGRIDILVNNAGISPKDEKGERIPTLDLDPAEWDRVMRINLKSIFLCTKIVGREMKKNRYGSILNISSMSAKIGNFGPPAAHYCASKAGVVNFTIYTAREFAPYGIRVNSIAPRPVRGLTSCSWAKSRWPDLRCRAKLQKRQPFWFPTTRRTSPERFWM